MSVGLRSLRFQTLVRPTATVGLWSPAFQSRIASSVTQAAFRTYATNNKNEGKQILLRDHGVFGKDSFASTQ